MPRARALEDADVVLGRLGGADPGEYGQQAAEQHAAFLDAL
jgi:hypothetical protein